MKNKGIILFAFGKKGYVLMAHNMAMSIKQFDPSINITLFIESGFSVPNSSLFENIITLDNNLIYTEDVGINPAMVKLAVYDLLPYEHNIYLDVDGITLQSIEPLFSLCINGTDSVITDIVATGGKNDVIHYSIWATNEAIFKHFKLKDTDILPSINSSWMYIRKDAKAKEIFEVANEYKAFPKAKLRKTWGGTLPDELIFSGTFAKLGHIPKIGYSPVFFGSKNIDTPLYEIKEKYTILSLYGNGRGRTMVQPKYIQWYDSLVKKFNGYESKKFMHEKHANG